jgi:S-formylglutathione hydrolase
MWTRAEIAGKPADVFDPGPGAAPFALVFLHDEAGDLPPELLPELAARRLRCVAPRAPGSWWVDRPCTAFDPHVTPERHVLDHVLPWARDRWKLNPRGVALAGIGMGGQGAVRLGFRHPDRCPVVAAAGGAFDFHERHGAGTPLDAMYPSREHARQDTAVLQVDGHRWPPHVWFSCPPGHVWYRGNDRLHEKLAALGVPHAADLDTPDAPAELLPAMLDFVAAALAREARRLA